MPHPGQKNLGRNAALAGKIVHIILLAMFVCNITVCITVCNREVGKLSSIVSKKHFSSHASVCWIWLRSVKCASKEIIVSDLFLKTISIESCANGVRILISYFYLEKEAIVFMTLVDFHQNRNRAFATFCTLSGGFFWSAFISSFPLPPFLFFIK